MLLFSREASVCSRHPTSGRGHFVLAQRECRGSHTHVNSGPSQLHQLLPVYCCIFQQHYHHTHHNHATVAICLAPHASQAREGRRVTDAEEALVGRGECGCARGVVQPSHAGRHPLSTTISHLVFSILCMPCDPPPLGLEPSTLWPKVCFGAHPIHARSKLRRNAAREDNPVLLQA
jgi:hypothetical protein